MYKPVFILVAVLGLLCSLAAEDYSINNSHFTVVVDDTTGMFNIGDASGNSVISGYPDTFNTHFIVSLDDNFYSNSDALTNVTALIPYSVSEYSDRIETVYEIGDVEIKQILEFQDFINSHFVTLRYEIDNQDQIIHDIGIAHFYAPQCPGTGTRSFWGNGQQISSTLELSGHVIPQVIQMYENDDIITDGTVFQTITNGLEATAPSMVIFGNSDTLSNVVWDMETDQVVPITSPGLFMRWNVETYDVDDKNTFGQYIGLGNITTLNDSIDLSVSTLDNFEQNYEDILPASVTVQMFARNNHNVPADTMYAVMELSENLRFANSTATQTMSPEMISTGEISGCKWAIYASNPQQNSQEEIRITLYSTIDTVEISRIIAVPRIVNTNFRQDFDQVRFPPKWWMLDNTHNSFTWQPGNIQGYSFSEYDPFNIYSAFCPYVDLSDYQDEWLISPTLIIDERLNGYLEFWTCYNSGLMDHTDYTVKVTTDDGDNWTEVWHAEEDNLSTLDWEHVAVDLASYTGEHIRIAWHKIGYDNDIVILDAIALDGAIDNDDVTLELVNNVCNYPNPFNPRTTISFSITEEQNINVSIYNIKGQKVKNLLNKSMRKGPHEVIWNGDDNNGNGVGSGVYFYKITPAKGESILKKCIMLK